MCLRTFFLQTRLFLLVSCAVLSFFSKTNAQCNPSAAEIPQNGMDEDCDGLDDIFLLLPPHIYLVEGKNFELYFRNTILSNHPQDYDFEVESPVFGQKTAEKWTLTPNSTQIGEFPITLRVKSYSGLLLGTATAQLRISPAQSPNLGTPKNLLLLGHSFIGQGYIPHYLRQYLDESGNPAVNFRGKKTNWVNSASNHEGKDGSTWHYFNKDPNSPIWYGGKLDFNSYFNEVLGWGIRPDVMVIHLDINDYCLAGTIQSNWSLQQIKDFIQADYWANIQPFLANLRAAAPNTKIALCMIPPPNSRQQAFNGFFGANTLFAERTRWKKIVHATQAKYLEYFANREQENLFLIPIHLDLDEVGDYDNVDPLHPVMTGQPLTVSSGYREIAKSSYAWIKYIFNLGATPACSIYAEAVAAPICQDNGTPFNPADDTFTFQAKVLGNNASSGWRSSILGQTQTGNYNTNTTFGPFRIADGAVWATFQDQNLLDCRYSASFVPSATCSNAVPTHIDLEVALQTTPSVPAIFSSFQVLLTVRNTGGLPAEGVTLRMPMPGNALRHVGTFDASQGNFRWYFDQIWEVGTIPPYGSATLAVDYFLNTSSPFALFAEVMTASPSDTDSDPGNAVGLTPQEDDEISFPFNAGNPVQCNLRATVLSTSCQDSGTPFDPADDTFKALITAENPNTPSVSWQMTQGTTPFSATFGSSLEIGPLPISGGLVTLKIEDADNSLCQTTLQVIPPAPCSTTNAPDCASTSANPWGEWIQQVQIGNFIHNTGKAVNNDFTHMKIPVSIGQRLYFSLQNQHSYQTYDQYCRMWIDYNHNGIFEEPQEIAFSGIIPAPAFGLNVLSSTSGFLDIPQSALKGETRLRVSLKRGTYPQACEVLNFGEVETYSVEVLNGVKFAVFKD